MNTDCCRVCLAKENLTFLYPKNMRSSLKESFFYLQCETCHSLSIKEIPENLPVYYENYYSFLPFTKENTIKKMARRLLFSKKKWLSALAASVLPSPHDLAIKSLSHANITQKMSILDVGCGSGQLVYQLSEAGFSNVTGIDAFLDSDTALPNGTRIYKRDIFTEKKKWDVVMLHHVFEHMTDPYSVLLQLQKITAEEGTIIIRVPNVDSDAFTTFHQNWFGIQAPIHIFLPSIQGMRKMVDESGWEIKNIIGENLIKFWEYNLAYARDVGHQDALGKEIFSDSKIKKNRLFKKEYKYWKNRNQYVLTKPKLCDWIVYYLKRKNGQ